jgi:hypothetical protein
VEGGANKFTTRSSVHVGLCGATSVLVRGQGEVGVSTTPNSIKFLRFAGKVKMSRSSRRDLTGWHQMACGVAVSGGRVGGARAPQWVWQDKSWMNPGRALLGCGVWGVVYVCASVWCARAIN